jgi:hypothetical protein
MPWALMTATAGNATDVRDMSMRTSAALARRRANPANPLGWLPKPYTMAALIQLVRQGLSDIRDENQ